VAEVEEDAKANCLRLLDLLLPSHLSDAASGQA
jgi:hypothetical protein